MQSARRPVVPKFSCWPGPETKAIRRQVEGGKELRNKTKTDTFFYESDLTVTQTLHLSQHYKTL